MTAATARDRAARPAAAGIGTHVSLPPPWPGVRRRPRWRLLGAGAAVRRQTATRPAPATPAGPRHEARGGRPLRQAHAGSATGGVVSGLDVRDGSAVTAFRLIARITRPSGTEPVVAPRAGTVTLRRAARALRAADARADLPAVDAPTLLLWGAHDALVPPAVGHLLRAEIAGARLLVLDGAGHVATYERPPAFNAALLAFLGGAPAGE